MSDALNLSAVPRRLIASVDQLAAFVKRIREEAPVAILGLDIESTGLDYPHAQIAGFSLYCKELNEAVYVPLGHTSMENLPLLATAGLLNQLTSQHTMVVHGGHTDITFLARCGVEFIKVRCTLTLSNMLQAQNAGLKDQVLEYGLVNFREVLSYKALMMLVKNLSAEQMDTLLGKRDAFDVWNFATINLHDYPRAVQYACDDSVWCRELLEVLESEHDILIGDSEAALMIRDANYDATVLLAVDAAQGYIISPDQLTTFIKEYTAEVDRNRDEMLDEVRSAMGWTKPAPPMPSLLDGL